MSRIGVTLGDPSGIGPEIVSRSLLDERVNTSDIVLIGNRENFLQVADSMGNADEKIRAVPFVDIAAGKIEMGKVSEESGRVAKESIEKAVELALKDEIEGVCTAPINKEAMLLAGSMFKDHTSMLAGLTGSSEVVTVFEVESLRIIFLSKHVSLREACDLVTEENVYRHIELSKRSLDYLGISRRKIAVAALNPHGGENGLFGREEIDEIIPAIMRAKDRFDVDGPIPADSVFHQAALGKYDIVLSMYHDQGHIAAKVYNFAKTVSMNLGLPFLRTSVDHGTAFDIAGKGIADHTSMTEAILKCIRYAPAYKRKYLEDRS